MCLKTKPRPQPGSSVSQSVVLLHEGGGFNSPARAHMRSDWWVSLSLSNQETKFKKNKKIKVKARKGYCLRNILRWTAGKACRHVREQLQHLEKKRSETATWGRPAAGPSRAGVRGCLRSCTNFRCKDFESSSKVHARVWPFWHRGVLTFS